MGCFRYPRWLEYVCTPDTSILFFHDCSLNEEYDTQESLNLLSSVGTELLKVGYRSLWILLNKQDSQGSMSAQEIGHLRLVYEKKLKEIFGDSVKCRVIEYSVSGKTGEGVKQVMEDLHAFITSIEQAQQQPKIPKHLVPKQSQEEEVSEDHKLKVRIEKEGSEDDMDPQQFWHSFLNADLRGWDHRSNLKSGFIVTLESIKEGKNVFDMAETFLGHIRRLRTMKPDHFRNTEHR